MLRRCAFPAWHFLWFWICSLIRSWLVCVVSILIPCIPGLILICFHIQKSGILSASQIFSFPAWHFLWFWICSLIHSWLVCVVSISISCISDLILTCSRIQKKDISATFQIFSKKKKVPKNQHFFIYYPCFLDINTTHSTCIETDWIFSKKKKVPKNQHFFTHHPYFLDINTTHSTCPVPGNKSTGCTFCTTYPISCNTAQSLAAVAG
ncbi:unknown [Ruminococcus sp. CAG:254]|nr:unknown [Ruminococcus sp. CAG:254]